MDVEIVEKRCARSRHGHQLLVAAVDLCVGVFPARQFGAHHGVCGDRYLHFIPNGGVCRFAPTLTRLETCG